MMMSELCQPQGLFTAKGTWNENLFGDNFCLSFFTYPIYPTLAKQIISSFKTKALGMSV